MIWKSGVIKKGLFVDFLSRLQTAEKHAGFDFIITSAIRKKDNGCHGLGRAVDLACHRSNERWRIVFALERAGFRRIGIYDRHIHVDDCRNRGMKVLWWGKSK